MCNPLLIYFFGLLYARFLVLIQFFTDAALQVTHLVTLAALVIADFILNHFFDVVILFRLLFEMLGFLLCQGKFGHSQSLHICTVSQVLHPDSFFRVFDLLLSGFLN